MNEEMANIDDMNDNGSNGSSLWGRLLQPTTTTTAPTNTPPSTASPPRTPPQTPSSTWNHAFMECTTPMTTRPHFYSRITSDTVHHTSSTEATVSPPTHQRQRSRSLGSYESDASATQFLLSFPSLAYGSLQAQTQPGTKTTRSDTTALTLEDSQHTLSDDILHTNQSTQSTQSTQSNVGICIVYGLINATMVLPITMSFGSIIYRDDALAPYIPVFVKLTIASGVVHQLCFSTFSTLPFAVGQVQDAGLIFLSSMASNIVQYCHAQNHDDETLLATVSVGLSCATCLLGFGLLLVGHGRLAQYMQLLPTCVVGGYLAFIGLFCGLAGVGLMVGSAHVTLAMVAHKWLYVLPGVVGGAAIYYAVSNIRHMATLPVCISLELVLFYAVLWATHTSVPDATVQGWIRPMDPAPVWYDSWKFLRLDKVDWMALPGLIGTEWLAMLFVCALSSSLDVAALELELNRPLDYNHELKMIGLSNILSGATGGYTGSYIFSQSIFSLRAGVRSRLAGYVLAACEILFIVVPVPILAYIPNFFFGSLLCLIAMDLLYEWLWEIRKKLTPVEYAICLATFGSINIIQIEYGILVGVTLYVACRKWGCDVGASKGAVPTPVDASEPASSPGDQEALVR